MELLVWPITTLCIYLHFMWWLWKYRDLKMSLDAANHIISSTELQRSKQLQKLLDEQDKIRTEMNGINLKLGLKLK